MKKNSLILILVYFFVISCDPGYRVIVSNNSNGELKLITEPPIEKNIFNKQSSEYILITKLKIKNLDSIKGYYKIPTQNNVFLFNSIGFGPGNYLPYKKVLIIKNNDTILVDSNNLEKRINKKIRNNYYIEIK
jgi:hypothetical protein